MNHKVSIIIPVYNAEGVLLRCLDSIIEQTYTNLEILVINDGSTDSSEKKCLEYKKKDNRIKYIKQKNMGVSAARNTGIKASTGEYIAFIDADDYIANDYIEKLINTAVKAQSDLVISGYTKVKQNLKTLKSAFKIENENFVDFNKNTHLAFFLKEMYFNACWKQLISSDLIKNNNIVFNKNIKYGEDLLFNIGVYLNSNNAVYIADYGYYYIIHDAGVMQNKSIESLEKRYIDNLTVFNIVKEKFNLSEDDINALAYKIFVTFNGITKTICKTSINIEKKRKMIEKNIDVYKEMFMNNSILEYCSMKQKINFYLLKNKRLNIYMSIKKILK